MIFPRGLLAVTRARLSIHSDSAILAIGFVERNSPFRREMIDLLIKREEREENIKIDTNCIDFQYRLCVWSTNLHIFVRSKGTLPLNRPVGARMQNRYIRDLIEKSIPWNSTGGKGPVPSRVRLFLPLTSPSSSSNAFRIS